MGRELRRKEAKRNGKNVREVQKLNKEKPMTMKTFITIIVTLIVFFIILYILTGIFITKDIKLFEKKNTTDTTENTISNKILGVDSLRQAEEEYYVYYYDTTNENSDISIIVNNLDTKVYRVDLHDSFNDNLVGEPSGVVSDISQLKVSDPTIIKVVSSTITEFYNGIEQIEATLK